MEGMFYVETPYTVENLSNWYRRLLLEGYLRFQHVYSRRQEYFLYKFQFFLHLFEMSRKVQCSSLYWQETLARQARMYFVYCVQLIQYVQFMLVTDRYVFGFWEMCEEVEVYASLRKSDLGNFLTFQFQFIQEYQDFYRSSIPLTLVAKTFNAFFKFSSSAMVSSIESMYHHTKEYQIDLMKLSSRTVWIQELLSRRRSFKLYTGDCRR